jgi:hypothetical protein
VDSSAGYWLVFAVVIAVAAWRWFQGPLAFVPPRPESRAARPAFASVARAIAFLPCFVPLLRLRNEGMEHVIALPVGLLVLAMFVEHALTSARRERVGASVAVFVVLLPLASYRLGGGSQLLTQLPIAAGCAFLVGWLRRADRRDGALAAIGFASTAWASPTLGFAGLAALVAGTHANGRRFATIAAIAAAALVALPQSFPFTRVTLEGEFEHLLEGAPVPALVIGPDALRYALLALVSVTAIAFECGVRGGALRESGAQDDAPRREVRALLVFVALALLLFAAERYVLDESGLRVLNTWTALLGVLTPAIVIAAGLVFLPAQRE